MNTHVEIDIVTYKWFNETEDRLIETVAIYLGEILYQSRSSYHPCCDVPDRRAWAHTFTTGYRECFRYFHLGTHRLREHVVEHCFEAKNCCNGGNPPRKLPVDKLTQTQLLAG